MKQYLISLFVCLSFTSFQPVVAKNNDKPQDMNRVKYDKCKTAKNKVTDDKKAKTTPSKCKAKKATT